MIEKIKPTKENFGVYVTFSIFGAGVGLLLGSYFSSLLERELDEIMNSDTYEVTVQLKVDNNGTTSKEMETKVKESSSQDQKTKVLQTDVGSGTSSDSGDNRRRGKRNADRRGSEFNSDRVGGREGFKEDSEEKNNEEKQTGNGLQPNETVIRGWGTNGAWIRDDDGNERGVNFDNLSPAEVEEIQDHLESLLADYSMEFEDHEEELNETESNSGEANLGSRLGS
jgi:hypothetical protein